MAHEHKAEMRRQQRRYRKGKGKQKPKSYEFHMKCHICVWKGRLSHTTQTHTAKRENERCSALVHSDKHTIPEYLIAKTEGIINAAYTFSGHTIIIYVLSRNSGDAEVWIVYLCVCVCVCMCVLWHCCCHLPIKYYNQTEYYLHSKIYNIGKIWMANMTRLVWLKFFAMLTPSPISAPATAAVRYSRQTGIAVEALKVGNGKVSNIYHENPYKFSKHLFTRAHTHTHIVCLLNII